MALVNHLVGANLDAVLRVEAAGLPLGTSAAEDIVRTEVPAKLFDVILEEANSRACNSELDQRLRAFPCERTVDYWTWKIHIYKQM